VGLLAGGQVARSWRRRPQRPAAPLVVLGAAALPAAASAGIVPMALAALVVVAAAVAAPALVGALGPPHRRGARAHANPALTVALALGVGLAAAAPVLVRHRGFAPAFVLLSLAGAYDASAYLVGSGASSAWEGPAAGVASIAAMTLAVAALFVPPFSGSSPWILGLVAAVLTPMGPLVGSLLLGERVTAAPALRRLDSLLVMGPLWAALALVLLK